MVLNSIFLVPLEGWDYRPVQPHLALCHHIFVEEFVCMCMCVMYVPVCECGLMYAMICVVSVLLSLLFVLFVWARLAGP